MGKITSIRQQAGQKDRYSIFVDGSYAFSLSEGALLESKLASGQELSSQQVKEYKKLSAEDKVYNRALRYAAMRPRSRWEMKTYLGRKDASPALTTNILNKLSEIGLLDEHQLARAYVADKQTLSPTSRRKIMLGLRKKRVPEEVISEALAETGDSDQAALRHLIDRKRKQLKYRDDLKLMQYLARQGFNYSDIKEALKVESDD